MMIIRGGPGVRLSYGNGTRGSHGSTWWSHAALTRKQCGDIC